jgi:putative pyrimidine permease RutG
VTDQKNLRALDHSYNSAEGVDFGPDDKPPLVDTIGLGFQHVLAMFGATVLAPILMGFDPNTAIFFSGISTIIFYAVVGGKVPSYLGSSFAFIAAVALASGYSGSGLNPNLGVALGGIFITGLVYAAIAAFVMIAGFKWIERIFPDIVSGTIVGIIGLSLAGVAVSQIGTDVLGVFSAFATLLVAVIWPIAMQGRFSKSKNSNLRIFEVIPIIIAGFIGYLFYYIGANIFGYAKPIDFSGVYTASIVGFPTLTAPVFEWSAILIVVPVVIVLLAENLGHIKAIGAMSNHDLNPYVGKAFMGDAIATMVSASGGGPGMTTYAENMAVMRLTRNFSSITFVAAGLIAIILGFSPLFGAIIRTIPVPVLGGLSLAMFGLITAAAGSIWQRGIKDESINFLESRSLLVAGIGLVLGAVNLNITI